LVRLIPRRRPLGVAREYVAHGAEDLAQVVRPADLDGVFETGATVAPVRRGHPNPPEQLAERREVRQELGF